MQTTRNSMEIGMVLEAAAAATSPVQVSWPQLQLLVVKILPEAVCWEAVCHGSPVATISINSSVDTSRACFGEGLGITLSRE